MIEPSRDCPCEHGEEGAALDPTICAACMHEFDWRCLEHDARMRHAIEITPN